MNKTTTWIIIILIILVGGYFIIIANNDEGEQDGEITIGWMGPLSGDAASFGESIQRGVKLAKKEMEAENISVVYENSKCSGKDAANAINKLINVDHVPAIIGEACSGATLAAAPIAQENEVVLMSAASTNPDISDAGSYIFRTVPSDMAQGSFGAQVVADDEYTKLAILYGNEDYGIGFKDVLEEEFPQTGGEIVATEAFRRGAVDLRTQLTKIKSANPGAIYIISNSPDSAVAALEQIEELNMDVAAYGSEGLKSDDILQAGDAAEGLTVTSVASGDEEFTQAHKEEFGSEPGPFSAQAYDAFHAIARAINEDGARTGTEIRDALQNTRFDGASGEIAFDENGDLASANYNVDVVKDGAFVSRGKEGQNGDGSSTELSDAEKEQIDTWIEENDLNEYGDPQDTVYTGGTPLFDEETGTRIERYDYILENHPERPWKK